MSSRPPPASRPPRAASVPERDPLGWVKEHPVAALLGAVAVGYALGGGIPTRTTRKLLSAGFKFALLPMLQREAEALLAAAAARPPP